MIFPHFFLNTAGNRRRRCRRFRSIIHLRRALQRLAPQTPTNASPATSAPPAISLPVEEEEKEKEATIQLDHNFFNDLLYSDDDDATISTIASNNGGFTNSMQLHDFEAIDVDDSCNRNTGMDKSGGDLIDLTISSCGSNSDTDSTMIIDSQETGATSAAARPFQLPCGASHPSSCYPGTKNAKWSEKELFYIQEWVSNQRQRLLDQNNCLFPLCSNLYAKCLKDIRMDLSALEFFHPRHIATSTRLRGGFEALARKRKNNKTPIPI